MARFWPKWRYNGRVMAREVSFYQCLWVTKLCAKFGCSRTPRTASIPKSFIVLRCMWKEPAPFTLFFELSPLLLWQRKKVTILTYLWQGCWGIGRITSLGNRPMDSVQVGKAVFVKESYTTLGIEPRTYSYPGRISYHNCVCWFKKTCGHSPIQVG